jgi:hypothetical protein
MADRFPLLTAAQSTEQSMFRGQKRPSKRQSFEKVVATVEAAHAAGSIPNPVYGEAKLMLNRAIERGWDKIADKHINGRFQTLPEAVKEFWCLFNHPQLHTIAGALKRAEKASLDHPLRDDVLAFLTEVAPLAAMIADLKTKVAKREITPVAAPKEGYEPPIVLGEAQAAVVKLLEQITQESYAALRQHIIDFMRRSLAVYLRGQDMKVAGGKAAPSPYDFFVRIPHRQGGIPNYDAERIVSKLVTRPEYQPTSPWLAKSDAEVTAIVEAEATKQADAVRTAFVHKNYRKIASIIDAKGNYARGSIVGRVINLQGLEGSLRFCFADGSEFLVSNKVVYVVNSHGTPFLRFPLTFHDVILPNGQRMGRPSEERMNTVFTKVAK